MTRDGLVSVVIPALNEASGIEVPLASVARQRGPWEAILSDGGSADDTVAVAKAALPGLRVVTAAAGRARQMNAGAAAAQGDVLLFLHADTALPEGALDAVRQSLTDPDAVAGCFRTDFGPAACGFGPLGRLVMRAWQAPVWMRWHRLAFGDRALFARTDAFRAAGGFPDQPVFEDLDWVRTVRHQGRFVFLDEAVATSPRRFVRNGAVRQQARNLGLWLGWLAGVPPARLKRFYPDGPGRRG